jgi:hypothetical protein
MEQNPYESPQAQCYSRPRRRPRVGVWQFTAIGAFLGVVTFLRFFHQPFGTGGGYFDDGMLVVCVLVGGYIGYSVRTMRLSPFSRS